MTQNTLFDRDPVVFDDITMGKHRGSATSIEANKRAMPLKATRRQQVLITLDRLGDSTAKEIAEFLGLPLHTVSGRCAELLANGMIEPVPDLRRDGGRVLRKKL